MTFKEIIMRLYNQRLDDRIARKQLLIERNLLLEDKRRAKNKDEKEFNNKIKIFMRFTASSDQYERMISLLVKDKFMNQALDQLRTFR